jgi:hypothetical protein
MFLSACIHHPHLKTNIAVSPIIPIFIEICIVCLISSKKILESKVQWKIAVFRIFCHWYIFWAYTNRLQERKNYSLKVNFNIRLPSMPRLRQLSGIPVSQAKSLYTPLSYPTRAVNIFQLIFLHWYGNPYKVDNIIVKYWMCRTDGIVLTSIESWHPTIKLTYRTHFYISFSKM